jgi:hypothetical protein
MLGPILMLLGLQHLSALTGSLLLNLEGPFSALIAVGLMREHLGRREIFAAATVSYQPGPDFPVAWEFTLVWSRRRVIAKERVIHSMRRWGLARGSECGAIAKLTQTLPD